MSSSLKRQLAALSSAPSSLLVPERRPCSILFKPSEAANYDRETFYQIGIEGLQELTTINDRLFSPFLHSMIFNEESKNLERSVEDESLNKKINEIIEDFLIAVSPYLTIKASLKPIEWLIHRFHIEKFNIGSLLECILPFHDTKSFVLIVQVLEIGKYKTHLEWKWLEPYVESAMAVPKAVLFENDNVNFVLWLFATLGKFSRVHIDRQSNLRVYVAFMTSTLIGIMTKLSRKIHTKTIHTNNKKAVAATLISQIKELFETISLEEQLQKNEEIHAMMYILIALLQMSTNESPDLKPIINLKLMPILRSILKFHPPSLTTEAYLLINMAVLFLKKCHIPDPSDFNKAMNGVAELSKDWDFSNTTLKLIVSNAHESNKLTPTTLLNWVDRIEMTVEQRSEILRRVYMVYKNNNSKVKIQKWAKDFLTRFERQYPLEFDIACRMDEQFGQDLAHSNKRRNMELMSQHSDANIRSKAINSLVKRALAPKIKKKEIKLDAKVAVKTAQQKVVVKAKKFVLDENPTAQLLWPRFTDDSKAVVLTLLKVKVKLLKKLFSTGTLIERLSAVTAIKVSKHCVRIALKKLCSLASCTCTKEEKAKIFEAFVPLMFPRTLNQLKYAKIILQSKFATKDEFFSQYKPVLEKDRLTMDDLAQFSYELISANANESMNFLWDSEFSTLLEIVFACLPTNRSFDVNKILKAAERFPCSTAVEYPVTKENFAKCIDLAVKKNQLSLGLVLTSILDMETKREDQLQSIFRFVWQTSERLDNKNACVQFLKDFTMKYFTNEVEETTFWCNMLLRVCVENSLIDEENPNMQMKAEYFCLRTLQFVTAFVKNVSVSQEEKILAVKSPVAVRNLRSRSIKQDTPMIIVKVSNLDYWPILEILITQLISHKSHRLRLWCLTCIEAVNAKCAEKDLNDFNNHLLGYRKEIIADEQQGHIIVAHALCMPEFDLIRNRFLTTVEALKADPQIIFGILDILKHISSGVFHHLTPTMEKLLASNVESQILLALLDCYDGSLNARSVVLTSLQKKQTCKKIIVKITREVYEAYSVQDKKAVFSLMVDTVLSCKHPEIKVSIHRCVRKWLLDATIVAHELVKCIGMQRRNSMSLINGKNTKADKNGKMMETLDADWTKKTEVILEFIQTKKTLKNKAKLIVPLFRILKTCIILEEQSPVEYLKQLVLTGLTICCQEDENSTKPDSDEWVHFNVELIIDCLRCSRNPQTHHHALILLNYAAKRFPEQVLHGIMSLFTFMGNSILRQDDTYSTQLIQQTVTSIIPTLAKTGRGNVQQVSTNLVSAGIFRVFTSAVQDIPAHRRVPVFTSLVETLDPSDSMWQICIIIVDNALNRDKKRSNLNTDLELAMELVLKFQDKIILTTLEKIYGFLMSLPLYNRELTTDEFQRVKNTQDTISKSILDISRKEGFRDVQLVVFFTLELVSKICSKLEQFQDEGLRYNSFLEKCLSFSRQVSSLNEDKIFRLIAHRNLEVVEKINAVLEPTNFVRVVISILAQEDTSVKRKIMDMLNQRIMQKVEWFKDMEVLLELLDPLVVLADTEPDNDETVVLIQTAYLSLKLIAKHLALTYPENFAVVCNLAFSHVSNQNQLLCSSALLCLGELFCLKSMILPNLKDITSAILKAIKTCAKQQLRDNESMEAVNNEEDNDNKSEDNSFLKANLLCLSTMTCLNKLVEQLGTFIGAKFLQKVLTAVLKLDGRFGAGEKANNRKKVFDQRLKTLLKTIAAKIPLRNSLVSIRGVFSNLVGYPKSIKILMGLLKENLVATSRAEFSIISASICDAFLEDFLPFREKFCENEDGLTKISCDAEDEELNEVEDTVLDCLITGIVLKMSEGHFRPFYHRIFDWSDDNLNRRITFYRLSAAAAERLKSLFTTFAGYVINKTTSFLATDLTLTQSILKFFYHIFFNDREGFITNDRFNSLVQPLVDLIESDFVISGKIKIKDINDTIVQLAVATNDLNRWQHLIELISYKSQHTNKVVRLFVISTLEAAANELGKDFLPLLPPAVPFLADLMGDEDNDVEAETQKMLLKLENIVGEPLQSYFTT